MRIEFFGNLPTGRRFYYDYKWYIKSNESDHPKSYRAYELHNGFVTEKYIILSITIPVEVE